MPFEKEEQEIISAMTRMGKIRFWDLIPGMTKGEAILLGALAHSESGSMKASELCNAVRMQPAAISRLMNDLEDRDLIVRSLRKGDRRVTEVSLTEKGKETDKRNCDIMHDYWQNVLGQIPEEDVKEMLRIQEEIIEAMEVILAQKLSRGKGEND